MYNQTKGKIGHASLDGISLTLIIFVIMLTSSIANPGGAALLHPLSVFGSATPHSPIDSLAGELYIGNNQSNSVSVIDLATDIVLTNLTFGEKIFNIELSEDQKTLYVAYTHSGNVTKINTTNNEVIGQIPVGVSVNDIASFNGTLIMSDIFGGKILVMNDNGTMLHTIKVGSGPQHIEVRPDGEVLYVANLWSPVSVVDLKQNKMIKELDTGDTPHGLAFTKDGTRLFLVSPKNDTLSVIDAYKHEVIKTIPVGNNPQYVALSPDETLAYVANTDSNTISVVDTKEIKEIAEIPVGDGPNGIAFSADGDIVYISNMRGNDVTVMNAKNGGIITTFSAGGLGPDQIIARKPEIEIVRSPENITISSTNNSSIVAGVFAEVADDEDEMMRGLMFRNHLPSNAGMLFVFDNEEPRTFWMKNTLIPLDMIFVDSSFKIVDILENVPPCDQGNECPLYPSDRPAQYVLEVNGGFVEENGIKVGDRFATTN